MRQNADKIQQLIDLLNELSGEVYAAVDYEHNATEIHITVPEGEIVIDLTDEQGNFLPIPHRHWRFVGEV